MTVQSVLEVVTFVLPGLVITLWITATAAVLGTALSIAFGAARLSQIASIRIAATVYVEVFRGTSLLVQLFYFYYVLPQFGLPMTPFWAGTLALAINASAYGSEIVRGAIQSVETGQRDAIIALNLRPMHAFRRVILPQAAARMVLPFGNLLIEMLKSTPLMSLIALTDLLYRGQMFVTITGRTTETYVVLLVIYFVIGWPLMRGVSFLHTRVTKRFARAV